MSAVTEYARVEDGRVVEIGPEPDAFQIPDTSDDAEPGDLVWVSTPDGVATDPKLLKKAGYLPVEDHYDDDPGDGSQYGPPSIEVKSTKVVRRFPIVAGEEPQPDPQAEHLTAIDQRVMVVEKYAEQYQPMLDELTRVRPLAEVDARALYAQVLQLRAEVAALRAEVRGE